MKDLQIEYPIAENEEEEDNTYLSYNMVVGNAMDSTLGVAFDVLDYALLSAPGAPLKQALLDAGIGKDIYGDYSDGVVQPYFSVIAKVPELPGRRNLFPLSEIAFQDIVKNGIDKKAVLSGINYMEFRCREADFGQFSKGLMYGLDIMGSWLYDDDECFFPGKASGDL
ncbi:MAG: hypothetical protein ACLU6Y_06460 [Ruminococcus sp.]